MDKLSKSLRKLNAKEREIVKEILIKLNNGDTKGSDIKKLKSKNDFYRIRKGNIRIIYAVNNNSEIILIEIGRRNDNTYKF